MANSNYNDIFNEIFGGFGRSSKEEPFGYRKSKGNPKFLQDEIERTSKIYSFAKTLSELKLCSTTKGLFVIVSGGEIIDDFSNLHEAKQYYIKMVIGDVR